MAFYSKADVLFYGGAAGGGKTDLLLGVAYHNHHISTIFRREFPQLKGVEDRSKELFGSIGKYNASEKFWRFLGTNKKIEFGAVQHEKDVNKHQGRAKDFIGFDEIPHFTEFQFRFLIGWLRSANPNQRTRIICAGNPPTSAEGDWVINYWSPWLDPLDYNPAKIGELRYYVIIDGKDTEVDSGDPFNYKGDILYPKSRTFIPAHVEDNKFLMESGYKSTLQALPEPLRSKMLLGDFTAGREDFAYQVIPTEWVKLAQLRWAHRHKPDLQMSSLGVDVARGGGDKTVLSPRYGNWFDEQIIYPGSATPDGPSVAQLILRYAQENSAINIDVIGVGTSVYDHTRSIMKFVYPVNVAELSNATDKSGMFGFHNLRAELMWKLREALDPTSGEELAIPDDRQLLADLTCARYSVTARGIKIEGKDEIKKRIGRSPDKGDALILAHADVGYLYPRITFY